MKTNKPLIGIIPDYRQGGEGDYSKGPYYALKSSYVEMLNKSGATSILLPYDYEMMDSYLEVLDGLIIVGGYFDINPARYGASEVHGEVKLNEIRENFEFEITAKALKKKNLPIFGICNGVQLINILHGGNAIQHIPDNNQYIDHEQSHIEGFEDYHDAYHEIKIEKKSKVFDMIGQEDIKVNSSHHQAVKEVGKNIKISAIATDGIIEAIEHETHPFCVGVQWHPEFNTSVSDSKLFSGFADACKKYKDSK